VSISQGVEAANKRIPRSSIALHIILKGIESIPPGLADADGGPVKLGKYRLFIPTCIETKNRVCNPTEKLFFFFFW
jgi:hypothetical protein